MSTSLWTPPNLAQQTLQSAAAKALKGLNIAREYMNFGFTGLRDLWQNGKVERLNRTLQSEWAYRQVFTSNAERAAALAPWLEHYNTRRRIVTLVVS